MGGIDVASVVVSIISAFGSGMEVFYRLGGKKRKSSARLPRPWEEQEWVKESLKTRPLQIKHEYEQSVVKFGRRFEVGDSAAHSSLAHTLLALNTGLINLINYALSADPKSQVMSQKALFNLSETAALDTMTALGQLKTRLSLASQPRLPLEPKENQLPDDRNSHRQSRKSNSKSPSKTHNRPSPTPLLVRGGWIRSKSGSSIVSVTAARKAREHKGTRTEKHSRSQSNSAAMKSPASQDDLHIRKQSDGEHSVVSNCTHKTEDRQFPETITPRGHGSDKHSTFQTQISEGDSRPQRQPSMLIVPADFFDTHVPARQSQGLMPPPRPPKIPLDSRSRPRPGHHGARPTSTMTIMTASTKIGEIPEGPWTERVDAVQDLRSRSPAYTIPPLVERSEPKKKKGLKFWKRDRKGAL
ncbi:hypothetical protein A1O3_09197 [Capronia epimyces CBS 606.96]|uniref:Uncharacterized protein n=1 Tax=Capronia epimyces CBS 606.96 TaxID=1182542 RepID=W9XC26_9EURO|nr:uncharacterized protein A1O3_09197 [Capronia epimyces CBS 606.96]EXJ78037.1 hypothetical protein A1O3_09197 [Capronia epimyces CBS 606.96]